MMLWCFETNILYALTNYLFVFGQSIIYVQKQHGNEVGTVKDILQEITRLRLERHWSEYELAVHSNLSQSTISTWYRKNQTPTIQSLEKICLGCSISLSQFFADSDDVVCLTSELKEVLDCWSSLTEKQREIFLQLFKNIL